MRRLIYLLTLFVAQTALGHDFWIEPSTFRPFIGETVSTRLRVGQQFTGDPIARSSQLIVSFVVRDGAGERPVTGEENSDPAGHFMAKSKGVILVGYRSNPSPIWLPGQRFEDYLRLEGLERILELRAQRGETGKPGRERFSRFAKSLLYSGPVSSRARVDRPFGFPLEIIPLVNPYISRTASLPLQLLYQSKPLAGALVVAMCDDPALRMTARSDAKGRVTFKLPRGGVWLVKAVHMIPSPPGVNAEWDSLWASLTFESSGGP